MGWILLSLGLLLVAEGLVWALAPRLIEELLAALRLLSLEQRRLAGLAAMALGLALLWLAHGMGVLPAAGITPS
ncbi:Uncharacterized protein putative in bacteria [Rubellimicrobium thermophilum DSM 16684]|uniref:Uncharacterized protein putative in bacteria n=1 Tax=Rubellimicrobium thermophilum DSM 16684 TaxID=1123069 RepID=S9R3E4_9RHOB|nr:DUF2065 family protein [Rubellimicrobium thermophilum]EPX86503.1 Uncharacterized protein putative in bacteria [Rubellimicrobium thermophilum DSM 16684]